jgi:hypothetical protein
MASFTGDARHRLSRDKPPSSDDQEAAPQIRSGNRAPVQIHRATVSRFVSQGRVTEKAASTS